MSRKRYLPEQIIGMLHEAEVRLSQGQPTGEICRSFGISASNEGIQNYGGQSDNAVAIYD